MKKLLLFFLLTWCIASQCSGSFAGQDDYAREMGGVKQLVAKNSIKKKGQSKKVSQKKSRSVSITTTQSTRKKGDNVSRIIGRKRLILIGLFILCLPFMIYFFSNFSPTVPVNLNLGDSLPARLPSSFKLSSMPERSLNNAEKISSIEYFKKDNVFLVNKKEEWLYYIKRSGNTSKELPFEEYSNKYVTDERNEAIAYRSFSANPRWVHKDFKKVYRREEGCKKSDFSEFFGRGYDLVLVTDGITVKDTFWVHPKLEEKFVLYFRCLARDAKKRNNDGMVYNILSDVSSFEEGILFSYAQEEVFAFNLLEEHTRAAYPPIKWQKDARLNVFGINEYNPYYKEYIEKGAKRLKVVFGDDYKCIRAGKRPSGILPERYESNKYTIKDGWAKPYKPLYSMAKA